MQDQLDWEARSEPVRVPILEQILNYGQYRENNGRAPEGEDRQKES